MVGRMSGEASPGDPFRAEILAALPELCRRFHVQRLDVFGSAATGQFDPTHSDVDLLVRYEAEAGRDLVDDYFGLKDRLELLFQRPIDLVMESAIKNPYFRRQVEVERRPLFVRS